MPTTSAEGATRGGVIKERGDPGKLHTRHRQGMEHPHRRKQPGTHPPCRFPHGPLSPRSSRAAVAENIKLILLTALFFLDIC